MNTLLGTGRSLLGMDMSTLLRLAIIAVVAIVVLGYVFKIVATLLPLLILAAIIFGVWQYTTRTGRGRRLP